MSKMIGGFLMDGARPGCVARGSFLVMLFVSLFGCSGPMLVTEYDDGMETGAEPYSVDKEDFRRNEPGVVPD